MISASTTVTSKRPDMAIACCVNKHFNLQIKLCRIVVLILLTAGCDEPIYEKPVKLIPRKQMINILVDIHLADAISQVRQYRSSDLSSLKSQDYYYSVLKKYNVSDSTFEKSLIYYASTPDDFEKMYSKVLDKLHILEQQYMEKDNQPVDVGNVK